MSRYGRHLERLAAVAVSRRWIAVGGARDTDAIATSHVHLIAHDPRIASRAVEVDGAVAGLAFAADDLLIAGTRAGSLVALEAGEATGEPARLATLALGAPVCAIACEPDAGACVAGTADGALHLVRIAMLNARPTLTAIARVALSERAITAVGFDASGPALLALAGGDDDTVWALPVSGGEPRAMRLGGEGGARAVVALGDGRIAAGFGDGSVRFGFLVGAVDALDRSGERPHAGAIRALVLGQRLVDAAGTEAPRRLFAIGEDEVVSLWSVDNARRPRTVALAGTGALTAAGLFRGTGANVDGPTGQLIVVSAGRKIAVVTLLRDGDPMEPAEVIESELDHLAADARDRRPRTETSRSNAVTSLAAIPEDGARVLLDELLGSDPSPAVRASAAEAIGRTGRRRSIPALRRALADADAKARLAAWNALASLEADQPLAALRAGLAAAQEDVRHAAVSAMDVFAMRSPLVAALAADCLADPSANVRKLAFQRVRELAPDALTALRTALARGPADVRVMALHALGFDPAVRGLGAAPRELARIALDDRDAGVRGAAFAVALVQHPRLAARVRAVSPVIAKAMLDAAARAGATPDESPPDAGALADDDLAPLFAAMACRNPDSALRGASTLVLLRDARAVGALLQLSREPAPELRRAAASSLAAATAIFPDDERLTDRLAWLLDDVDPQARAAAFDALAARAGAAVDAALDLATLALRASQDDVRVRALQIVVKHQGVARADAALGDALDDEAAAVRAEAYRTLWAWHAATPMVPLERAAKSRHADLRGQVVAELARRREAKQGSAAGDALLLALVRDASADVGLAAHRALTVSDGDQTRPEPHLAAMSSPVPSVRAAGATGAAKAPAPSVRAALIERIKEDQPVVHLAAIEAYDHVLPNDAEGFALAFASIFYVLQVRAGELCGRRRDRRAVAPMQRLLSIPKTDANRPTDGLRQAAARALADVGDPGSIAFLVGLLGDDDAIVREMGARGLATACRADDLKPLVDALAHLDLPVRSWAAEGLARHGDLRALPVLAGTQRHEHRPLRIGAIVGFVALGPDGVRGLRQGLDDPDREVQDLAFAVIVARDVALARAGLAPDLLLDTLSSPSPELRLAGARLVEARASRQPVVAEELVGPRKPEKAADLKEWPPEPRRAAIQRVLVDAIASDDPALRYASAQVLALRPQPLTFWREAARLAGPTTTTVPHTSGSLETRAARKAGWLRRIVVGRAATATAEAPAAPALERLYAILAAVGGPSPRAIAPQPPVEDALDAASLRRLVFGVYAGLVRQAPGAGAGPVDETQRVRRDAVERLVALARDPAVGRDAVLPLLGHALRDPHHLVRAAAMAGLRALHPAGALAPLAQALDAAADVGKAAIDELLALALRGDDGAAALVRGALDADDAEVRAHALARLPRLYPPGAAAPLLLAARSRHGDVRLAALARIPGVGDDAPAGTAVSPELGEVLAAALISDQPDLRFKAAAGLARRGDERGVDVLAGFLRAEAEAGKALDALIALGTASAAAAISARLDDDPDRTADRRLLCRAIGAIGDPAGAPALIAILGAPDPEGGAAVRVDAFDALLEIARDRAAHPRKLADGGVRVRYHDDRALFAADAGARCADPAIRERAARALGDVDDRGAEERLGRLLGDREASVRVAAAEALAVRAAHVAGASLAPLEAALRGGRRELVLPAAEGLARRGRPEAFQPALLVLKAGEGVERERALLALAGLGDRRAIEHIVPLLDPANESEPDRALAPAAAEALGRLMGAMARAARPDDAEAIADLRERIERLADSGAIATRTRALTGLRHAGDPRSRGLLERIATDRDEPAPLRAHAVEQLARLADPASEPALADLIGDDAPVVRQAALRGLRAVLGGDRTRTALRAVGVRHVDIARPAARFLAARGDAATLVARLGEVHDAGVRRALREGLVRRGGVPRAPIEAALGGDDPAVRVEAAWLAGAAGDAALAPSVARAVERAARGYAAARREVRGAEADAWRAALWAARRTGAPIAASASSTLADLALPVEVRREAAAWLAGDPAALAGAVGDVDPGVRTIAARAVASVPARAAAAVRALGSQGDPATAAPAVAAAFGEVAGELFAGAGTRSLAVAVALRAGKVTELVKLARTRGAAEKDEARLAAIAALGRIGGEEAKRALAAIVADKTDTDEARAAAFRALRRLQRAAATAIRHQGEDRERKRGAAAPVEEEEPEEADEEPEEEDDEPEEEDDDEDEDDDD